MKKTVTANLAGTVFHIEEDAYEQLQRYLGGIRANFSGSPGAEEIMGDIEARIGELFTERMVGRNVVTITDVQHVESVMGRPEDFAGESAESTSTGGGSGPQPKGNKRFMRDPDDKWIGGVIGGLAAYIGTEAIWFRIAFILAVYFGWGTPIFVYILLWILVPKAGTAAERLQMRGEPVTVENIKRVVEEGGERIKQGAERMADEAKDVGKDWGPRAQRFGSEASGAARRAGSGFGHVLKRLIGAGILLFAFSMLLGLITGMAGSAWGVLGGNWNGDNMGLLDAGSLLFNSRAHAMWMMVGVFTLLAVPVIGLFLAGFNLLLDTRAPRWLGWTLAVLWFGALFPTVISGMDLGNDFRRKNTVRSEIPILQPTGTTLYLDMLRPSDSDSSKEWSVEYDDGDVTIGVDGLRVEDGTVLGNWGQCDVEQSADSAFHLIAQRTAHGRNTKLALQRAERTAYEFKQEGDALALSPIVRFPADDKIRAQYVRFIIQVPVGKSIFFRNGSEDIIDDVDNTTNTYDDDMIGKSWTMTPQGLHLTGSAPVVPSTDSTTTDTILIHHPVVYDAPQPEETQEPDEDEENEVTMEMPNLFRLFSRTVHI